MEQKSNETKGTIADHEIDFNAIQVAAMNAHDFSDEEKEAIKSEVIRQKKIIFQNKVAILLEEWEKAKRELAGMKAMGAKKEEILEQQKFARRCYDAYKNYKADKQLDVPSELFELLEIDECSKVQKIFLINFCYNGGSSVEACSKSNVTLRQYRKWLEGEGAANEAFKNAIKDIDQAYLDIAEMKLKKMTAENNVTAVKFFLQNKHDAYKATNKLVKERKVKRTGAVTDYKGVDSKEKSQEFMAKMGMIKEDSKGNDKINE